MPDYTHFPEFSIREHGIEITVSLKRFEPLFQKAQYALDSAIMASMEPYMPMQTGSLIQRSRAESAALAGTGTVVAAAAPYGRYQYFGKKMVDSRTGKGPRYIPTIGYRFMKGATLRATDEPLTYGRASATPLWFETAKQKHGKDWIGVVQRVINGG